MYFSYIGLRESCINDQSCIKSFLGSDICAHCSLEFGLSTTSLQTQPNISNFSVTLLDDTMNVLNLNRSLWSLTLYVGYVLFKQIDMS
jgi:hypothetical protein